MPAVQRMAFRERNGETRLLVRDVSPDMLVQQAAAHVATLPIEFTGDDASDVTTITTHVDRFLSQGGTVLSEEERSEVVSRAVERYLQNPEIAEDRKRMQTWVEESAVADAQKQLTLRDPKQQTLASATAALSVPEGVGKAKLAREIVASIQTDATVSELHEQRQIRWENEHAQRLKDAKKEQQMADEAERKRKKEEGKKTEQQQQQERKAMAAHLEKQRLEAKARNSQKKSEDECMSVHGRAHRDQKEREEERERQAEVAAKEREKEEKESYEKDGDMHERLAVLSSVNVDKSQWNMKRGVPVEDDPEFAKPEAAPPEEAWNPGPARPLPPRAKATIEYGGATFDSFVDRPAHASIEAGKYVAPAERFLQSILSAQRKRGAIEVLVRDGMPELRVNGQSTVVGSDKIHSYVRETLMPFVKAIEDLRRLGGPQMVTGYAKVDRKESARFSVGHNAKGIAELRVEGPKPVVKQGATEVLRYIETKLPYKKDELKTLFQPVEPVSADDIAPTVPKMGVASLHLEALRKDKEGCERLYACYDPGIKDESTWPLKSFECDPLFRGPIEPPPAKATRALEAAERALEEAEEAATRAKTPEVGIAELSGKEPVHLSRVDIGGQVDRLIMRLGLRN